MSTRQGFQPGAPMGDKGEIWFTEDVAARIADSGAAWVRLNFRLGPKVKDWTDEETLGFSALSRYDTIVETALSKNLKVLGLLCNEAWQSMIVPGEWRGNSAEVAKGSGDNEYIRGFTTGAAALLYQHFAGAISHWQIWNEPNSSATYLYPSNFAWLLARAYTAARESGVSDLTIIAGGILSTHGMKDTTLTATNTGADYLRDTYWQGIARAGWTAIKESCGSYPLDGVGQHLYIDQWYPTSADRIEQAVGFMRDACAAGEDGAAKPIYITELGWSTDNVNEQLQADNLKIACVKLKQMPCVARSYWFFLKDEPSAKLAHGLLRPDGSEKPAWQAFQDINNLHIYPQPQRTLSSRYQSWRHPLVWSSTSP